MAKTKKKGDRPYRKRICGSCKKKKLMMLHKNCRGRKNGKR